MSNPKKASAAGHLHPVHRESPNLLPGSDLPLPVPIQALQRLVEELISSYRELPPRNPSREEADTNAEDYLRYFVDEQGWHAAPRATQGRIFNFLLGGLKQRGSGNWQVPRRDTFYLPDLDSLNRQFRFAPRAHAVDLANKTPIVYTAQDYQSLIGQVVAYFGTREAMAWGSRVGEHLTSQELNIMQGRFGPRNYQLFTVCLYGALADLCNKIAAEVQAQRKLELTMLPEMDELIARMRNGDPAAREQKLNRYNYIISEVHHGGATPSSHGVTGPPPTHNSMLASLGKPRVFT
ncbi:hypothetical protein JCM11641_002674 [Rhodosporidiobolus odoratus]